MEKLTGVQAVLKTLDDLHIRRDELRLFTRIDLARLLKKVALLIEGDDYGDMTHPDNHWRYNPPAVMRENFKSAAEYIEWIDRHGGNPLAKQGPFE